MKQFFKILFIVSAFRHNLCCNMFKLVFMRQIYLPALLLLSLFIGSCQCHEYVKCMQPYDRLYITGYTASEVDTVVVKRYNPDNSFSSLVDSMVYPLPQVSVDTFSAGIGVEEKYNYDIELKKPGRHYRISNMVTEGFYYKDIPTSCFYKKMPTCTNHITSIKIDDATVQLHGGDFDSPSIYLMK